MSTLIDQYFLEADQLISYGEIIEAKNLLEKILSMEPDYGKAHNHLGWVYHRHLSDFALAEKHFQLAIKFAPNYPATYLNYAYLLNELGQFEQLRYLLDNALKMSSVPKSMIYNEYGKLYELNENYEMAINEYRKAIRASTSDEDIGSYKANVSRCNDKKKLHIEENDTVSLPKPKQEGTETPKKAPKEDKKQKSSKRWFGLR
ncbi:tetratricopeptide repeat protein [Rapidithrix thailandica]|uniref:Tetratricopeptide repeat protein n=1 Tax=Rapidithrix thailandica TaxID=413964 RepID=A0AAW9S0E3_9BACT